MTDSRIRIARPPLTRPDDPPRGRFSVWLTHRSSSSFLLAAGLLAATGTLLITEDRTGVTLFPVALTALALGAIALATALGGLTAHRRRHELRGGLVAMAFCGIVAASGVVLAVMVPVGIATGGLTGDAPAVVDRVVTVAMLSLALGLFLALLLSGIGAWRARIPSRGIGVALIFAALPFLAPALFAATGFWMDELVGLALFVIWTAIFGGIGVALRRG
jgi:hypothetical protein